MTIYVDDLTSRTLDFRVAGGKLVLGINFATTAPHIRMDCFADILCLAIGRPTITFAAPRAELSFGLSLVGGSVRFTDVTTTFATGNTDGRSIAAGNAIASAITERITSDATIRSSLDGALDAAVRIAGRLGLPGASLTIESLSLAGNTMTIRPGCAQL